VQHRHIAQGHTLVLVPDGAARERECVGTSTDHGGAQGLGGFAHRKVACSQLPHQRLRQQRADVAKAVGRFVGRMHHAFTHPTRNKYRVKAVSLAQRIGHQQLLRQRGGLGQHHLYDQRRHAFGDLLQILARQLGCVALCAKQLAQDQRRWRMHCTDTSAGIGLDQMATHIQAGGVDHPATFKHRVVGGAAAHVDIQHARGILLGIGASARVAPGNHRLQMRPRGGDHKVAQAGGERHHRVARVAHLGGLAGDDDGA